MTQRKSKFIEEDGCLIKVVHIDQVNKARKEAIPEKELNRLSLTYKVLGEPTRLKILISLLNREMCVCDLAAFTGLSESATSHQLRRLKDLALIKQRREGQILYNSINDEHITELIKISLDHIREEK